MFSPTRPSAVSVTNAVSGRSRYCAFSGVCNDLNSSAFIAYSLSFVEAFMSNAWAPASALAQAPLHLLGLNVLIHAEEIIGIVFLFNRDQPVVIAAVGFLHAFLAFIAHKEVYVRSARGIRMHRIVKIFRPRNNFL